MQRYTKAAKALTLGLLLASAVTFSGCAGSVRYRSYDPYYRDYHVWGGGEQPYYDRWVIETRRPHYEYRRLRKHDRDEYWRWRHDHR